MSQFLKGAAFTVVLALALVGVASVAGVDIGVTADLPGESDAPQVSSGGGDVRSAAPTATAAPSDGPTGRLVRQAFVRKLNAFRSANGKAEVSVSMPLTKASVAHAEDMAARGYFDHASPSGETVEDRLQAGGRQCSRPGENIAQTWWRESLRGAGPDYIDSDAALAEALLVQWRNSPGHREIMLQAGATDVGLGIGLTEEDKVYATMVIC
jgi:uncharacterized protein YkwD